MKLKGRNGRRGQRLWKLPESSIDEYVKWIVEKPEEDQTPDSGRKDGGVDRL